MPQIVHHPRRQQLSKGDSPETRMLTGKIELARRQRPGTEQLQIRGAQPSELVEQRGQRAAGVTLEMAESIVRLEAKVCAPREDDARSRDPIRLLAVDQM